MTASQLRINNLFKGYDGKILKWALSDFTLLERGIEIDEIVHEPIPLTEEWLLKIGFECVDKYYGYYTHIDLCGLFILRENNTLLYSTDSHDILVNPIQYLHQLQNLYFALTGEELEVKL